jgi:hypothetical protein
MREYEVLGLFDMAADLIDESCGMNVPYTESLDMSLLHEPIYLMLDREDGVDLGDLQFLATCDHSLPVTLATATMDQFKAYCKEHREEILDYIEDICRGYIREYSDEPTYLDGRTWDELSEHDKGVIADLEM